jgi:hypothetical protein
VEPEPWNILAMSILPIMGFSGVEGVVTGGVEAAEVDADEDNGGFVGAGEEMDGFPFV